MIDNNAIVSALFLDNKSNQNSSFEAVIYLAMPLEPDHLLWSNLYVLLFFPLKKNEALLKLLPITTRAAKTIIITSNL